MARLVMWGIGIALFLLVHPWAGMAWGAAVLSAWALGDHMRQYLDQITASEQIFHDAVKNGSNVTFRYILAWIERLRTL